MTVVRANASGIILESDDHEVSILQPSVWPAYRKLPLTHAMRMEGPFTVEMPEGPAPCSDGYLAVDARGIPYPIAADEFDLIYAPIETGERVDPHPAAVELLRYFAYGHLPAALQVVSRPFAELAEKVAHEGSGPETTTALRKLLEAKDCAVRAALPPAPAYPLVGKG